MRTTDVKEILKPLIPDTLLGLRGRALHIWRDIKRIPNLVESTDSYYPDADQKPKYIIVSENIWWRLKHRQLNNHYFLFGLDRKNASFEDYLPHPRFTKLRDSTNDATYRCTLRDKFIFSHLADTFGYPTPENIALLEPDRIEWLVPVREIVPFESIRDRAIDGICKPLDGGQGRGIFALRVNGGALAIDGTSVGPDDLRSHITEPYILQERIEQHNALSKLYPSSVNTLRLITARTDDGVHLLSSVLRVGAGGSHTDNWSTGGLIAYINPETGATELPGVFKYGPHDVVTRHPDTNVDLDGYEIPHFEEAVDLACRFHRDLRGLHTVGWDVAITPNGPMLLEGNSQWGASIPQTVDDSFKERFMALFDEE